VTALHSFRVLELAEGVAGEYAGKLIADFGAEVIKLEKPGVGSPTRRMAPLAAKGDAPETSGLFAYLNTNKHSVAIEVTREMLAQLLPHVDVVIDDHAPGWLKKMGLDPAAFEAAYPHLILCSITPFGQDAPPERAHAEDITVFHASGWGYHTPSGADEKLPPLSGPGPHLPSYEAGLEAALCVAASLYDQMQSGRGRFIDISKQAVLTGRIDYVVGQMASGDMDVTPSRAAFDLFGPADIFPTRDGYAYIWLSSPAHWQGLRKLLGDPDWMQAFPERWLERECTAERVAECRRHIAAWLATQNKHEAAEQAQKLGVTLVAVNTAKDVMASPQFAFRKFFAEAEHAVLGKAAYPTVPYQLSVTPAAIRAAAPLLGQHAERLDALRDEARR
jgi:crotonobetainyl-CoA:carnitine CoA-transferase CaiB-like acyl-CoA transferase